MQPLNDTIAALATAPGEGGIAIVRISGKEAIPIADRIFSGPVASYLSHTAHFGRIMEGAELIDEAICLVMRAPKSYTGEDVVELQCHGGMVASKKVLDVCLRAGARAALAGEFTFRAYMNGKLDLAQAEAVQQLISAKNEQAYGVASKQLEGALSKKILSFQRGLTQIAAILEAWVDFPEEGLEFTKPEKLLCDLTDIEQQIAQLLQSWDSGKKISHGITTAIVGAPNAGKSSLLNALLEEERAIVTPHPGTTRDLLYEDLNIEGLTFRLIDTAGIRNTEEEIEKEGIARTQKAIETADLILFVLDVTQSPPAWHATLPKEKTLCLLNKIDLPHTPPTLHFSQQLALSTKTGQGLEQLCKSLAQFVWQKGGVCKEELLLTSVRHARALYEAKSHIEQLKRGLIEQRSAELLTADSRAALMALGRIIGADITEDILSSIFSTFCIGK